MAKHYVKTDGLNLRKKPNGRIIRSLKLRKRVEVLGNSDVDGWKEVSVRFGDDEVTGHVFGKYLRKPESKEKEALLKACADQWIKFKRGDGKEDRNPFYKFVGKMWKSIGINHLDGRDSTPWSAAFISYVVADQAGYEDFPTKSFHTHYIHDAIQNKVLNRASAPFWGYRRLEEKPELGDIVCAWRRRRHDYHDLENSDDFRPSHCDVIVEINEESVRVIGGNVRNSVSMKSFPLNSNGFLKGGNKVTALMKNRL